MDLLSHGIERLRLAWELARQDLQARFAGSFLGGLWIFIWPLVQMFIYIVIFGKFMGGRLPGNDQVWSYGVYVASGLVSWTLFSGVFLRCTRMFADRKHIIAKVRVPLLVFPVVVCLTEALPCIASLILLLAVDLLAGWRPDLALLGPLLLALYCQVILAVGLGLFCATLAVFMRDVLEMAAILVQIWFWFTPVVYLANILPDWVQALLVWNPLFAVAASFQGFFLLRHGPEGFPLCWTFLTAHAALLLGLRFFRKMEHDIRDAL